MRGCMVLTLHCVMRTKKTSSSCALYCEHYMMPQHPEGVPELQVFCVPIKLQAGASSQSVLEGTCAARAMLASMVLLANSKCAPETVMFCTGMIKKVYAATMTSSSVAREELITLDATTALV